VIEEGEKSIPAHDLAHLLLCSFRYALGRMTYITGMCADWLETWWHILPPSWQEQIQKDIRQAIASGHAGHACDVAQWKRVLQLPLQEERR
jgi:hypothetical protein